MKLTDVEIFPAVGNSVALSFKDPKGLMSFNVKSILGLDADEITPQYYTSVTGANFYNLILKNRTIIVKIGLNPVVSANESYSTLRDYLYKIIASNRSGHIRLNFMNGSEIVASISGFISKFETPHFEKNQEVQITINCDEPFLKAAAPTQLITPSLDPAFTFLTDNKSTAPHGFIFYMDVLSNTSGLFISDPTDASWRFLVGMAFVAGDTIIFSSEVNNKGLLVVRGATTINIADKISPPSVWPILFPGDNYLSFQDPTHFAWNYISYYPTYWGV